MPPLSDGTTFSSWHWSLRPLPSFSLFAAHPCPSGLLSGQSLLDTAAQAPCHQGGAQAQASAGAYKVPIPSCPGQDPKCSLLGSKGRFLGGGRVPAELGVWETPNSNHSPPPDPSRAWRTAPKAACRGTKGGDRVSAKGSLGLRHCGALNNVP